MSIRPRIALAVSMLAMAASPLAAGHDLLKMGTATTPLSVSEAPMQAQSSEAPAWHTGDGSIYDSSRMQVAMASPSQAPNTVASNEHAPATASSDTTAIQQPASPTASSNTTVIQQPAAAIPLSARGAVNRGRYDSMAK